MGKRQRTSYFQGLPDDLTHIILRKLDFKDKINAGLVCKLWEELLRADTPAGKHWVVEYNADSNPSSTATPPITDLGTQTAAFSTVRWFAKRAAIIKSVRVSATIKSPSLGALDLQLPMLAGCLSNHIDRLDFVFSVRSPFAAPLMYENGFVDILCPMVKSLNFCNVTNLIDVDQIALICKLTCLEELSVSACGDDFEGLEALTAGIGELVNLRVLTLRSNNCVDDIPDSITCLQKLEHLHIENSPIQVVPDGITTLTSLTSLRITRTTYNSPRFPVDLQSLRNLTTVAIGGTLEAIPEQLSGLSALTSLEVCGNNFISDGPEQEWWPATLSRLTRLAELVMRDNYARGLPAHISGLVSLTKLDVSHNQLASLPPEVSSLTNLKEVLLKHNNIEVFPVSIFSCLTALNTVDWSDQQEQEMPHGRPQIPSSLLPMLHPGLVKLDLRQSILWDTPSLVHLGHAMSEMLRRKPIPTLLF